MRLRRYAPAGPSRALRVVLAHGAGAGSRHPFLVACAKGLAARGIHVTTFDFGARTNDALERTLRRAVDDSGGGPVVLGGKSMGGRIASQVVAAGGIDARGLFFLGYPLHPPKKPEELRVAHWPRVEVPCLFVQGTRDPFGNDADVGRHVTKLAGPATIVAMERCGHSFVASVWEQIWDTVADFVVAQGKPRGRVR